MSIVATGPALQHIRRALVGGRLLSKSNMMPPGCCNVPCSLPHCPSGHDVLQVPLHIAASDVPVLFPSKKIIDLLAWKEHRVAIASYECSAALWQA
jgi:hypothetical protein